MCVTLQRGSQSQCWTCLLHSHSKPLPQQQPVCKQGAPHAVRSSGAQLMQSLAKVHTISHVTWAGVLW